MSTDGGFFSLFSDERLHIAWACHSQLFCDGNGDGSIFHGGSGGTQEIEGVIP